MESIVRLARPEDTEGLLSLLRLAHEENGFFTMDDDTVRAVLRRGIARDGSLIGVIGEPGLPEASVGLVMAKYWYTKKDHHLEDLWNYVHPAHRRSRHAKSLIKFAEKCGDELGLPVIMGVLSTDRTAAKVRLYERHMPHVGAIFLHRPETKVAVAAA